MDEGLGAELRAPEVDEDSDDARDDPQQDHHDQGSEEEGGAGQGDEPGDVDEGESHLLDGARHQRGQWVGAAHHAAPARGRSSSLPLAPAP